jgi:hypothetical protein
MEHFTWKVNHLITRLFFIEIMSQDKKKFMDMEEAFRFSTLLFMLISFCCIVASLISFENNNVYIASFIMSIGIAMLCVTLWTYFHSFYPVVLGLVLYALLIGLVFYINTGSILGGSHKIILRYLAIGLIAIVYTLIIGYKEWQKAMLK